MSGALTGTMAGALTCSLAMPLPTKPKIDAPGDSAPRHPRSRARLLIVFVMASMALHAAVLVALPGLHPVDRNVTSAKVLEVVLVHAESPPRIIDRPVPPSPQPQRRAPERVVRTPVQPEPQRQAEMSAPVPAPVFALPEPHASREPAFTVPAPKAAETRAAPAETRTDIANLAVTPPSFGAAYLRNPAPFYPHAAARSNVQGTVMLRVLVTREGLPARVELEKSSGSAQLDQAALETVKTWRFAPARRGTEPVEDTVIVPIVFRLERAA